MRGPLLILVLLFFVVAALLWLGLVVTVATLNESDPAGNGLSQAYGVFMTIGLWVALALLLLVAGARGRLPAGVGLAAVMLVPLTGAATLAAIELLRHPASSVARWPIVIPALAPPLLMGWAAWALWPTLRGLVPVGVAGFGVGGLLLLIGLAPWPLLLSQGRQARARRAGVTAAFEAGQASAAAGQRRQDRARFDALAPDAPLWQWLEFTADGNALREEALAAIRRLPRRQADAEALLGRGHEQPLRELPALDLAPTPALCTAAVEFMRQDAERLRRTAANQPLYSEIGPRLERFLPALRWLVERGCECEPALVEQEAAARHYPADVAARRYLNTLAELRRGAPGAP